jgi:hypothetical protein
MDGRVRASDRLAVYVGLEAFEAAGGKVLRDLFDAEAVFIENPPLLTKLAGDKLAAPRAHWLELGRAQSWRRLWTGSVEQAASSRMEGSGIGRAG